jgi:ATP-dependent DNA helicase RecG
MLTETDIKMILGGGEAYNAEFKVAVPSKLKELVEEVCAFANSAGGYLLIGIDNRSVVVGVKIDNSKRSAIQNAIREISPALYTELYSVEVDGKTVWVIDVPSGRNQPYLLSGVIYIREGANTQKLTSREEIQAFFQQCDRIHFDEILCPDFDIQKDVDEENYEEFCKLSNIGLNIPRRQVFESLKLIGEGGFIKNAGVMFFGKSVEKFFFHAVIHCVCFKGVVRDLIIDNKVYGGAFYCQYLQAFDWLKNKMSVRFEFDGGNPRKEVWEIPLEVFREAILNALSHRDYYEKGGEILIAVFDDRVEITNPGGLLPAVVESFGEISLSRNPTIFGLFTRMHVVEHVGSGIRRMKKLTLDAGLSEPQYAGNGCMIFTIYRKQFKTELVGEMSEKLPKKMSEKKSEKMSEKTPKKSSEKSPEKRRINIGETPNKRHKNGKKIVGESSKKTANKMSEKRQKDVREDLTERQKKILEIIKLNYSISAKELSIKLKNHDRTIERDLEKLKSKKIIKREGGDRGGYWIVIKKTHRV